MMGVLLWTKEEKKKEQYLSRNMGIRGVEWWQIGFL